MRDLKKLGALQRDKRLVQHKTRGAATKKSKRTAPAVPVDSDGKLLDGKRVLLVPVGPDMSRKRLEVLQGMVYKLGGSVVDAQAKTDWRTGAGSHEAVAVKWNECDIIIASAGLKVNKAAGFLRVVTFPPPNIEVYTPEWLVYMLQKNELPPASLLLTWSEQQHIQEEAVIHEQHCAEVAQQVEEKKARARNDNESDSDEGSNSENPDTHEIVRADPVTMDNEVFCERQAELDEKKKKLVEERVPIFYKNNPHFRPITEGAIASSKKVIGEGFISVHQNLNAHLTDPLEEMMEFLDVERDVWRHYMYKWVKGRLRDKVTEILETGRLAKLDAKKKNPRLRALVKIARVWGVGPVTAAKFYRMGYTSIEDLRKPEAADILKAQQKIGVKHYEDFLTKIPRAEVQQIERIVADEVHQMIPNATALACGSYRRGKTASGDCDILITDPDADSCDILPGLLERLHASDDLMHSQKQKAGGCDTYMGVCRVSKDRPYRRLDVKVYPRHFFGFAILYFTGSDHFNRSMRLFAHKNGWSLSDRALTQVVRANGTTVRLGDSVICESEVDVFIALGLEYKDPIERNCFDIKFLDEDEAKATQKARAGDAGTQSSE
uniref:DNA polymerase n=1 Tax=Hyaloperonospora arabidopsidis (strain Emoy2) TaxID=559515 RepID=M4B6V3_HYAAE